MANDFEATQQNSQHIHQPYSVSIPFISQLLMQIVDFVKRVETLQQEVGHFKAQSLNCEERVRNVEEDQENLKAVFSQTVTSALDTLQEQGWKLQMYEDYTNPD